MLLNLTRLGAKDAYHLCDKSFAGAYTLATAYTLSLAIKKLQLDLVIFSIGRGAVDTELQPYHRKMGITGKIVTPVVNIAIGISGAVHHIACIKQSGIVIEINSAPKAPYLNIRITE